MLELLMIAIITVFIVDLSGVIQSISETVFKWLYPKVKYNGWLIPKPFSCSLCMTWWIGLLWLLVTGSFTVYMITYVALLAYMTTVINNFLILIRDLLIKLIDNLYKHIY